MDDENSELLFAFEVHISRADSAESFTVVVDLEERKVCEAPLGTSAWMVTPDIPIRDYVGQLRAKLSSHPLAAVLKAKPLGDLRGCTVKISSLDSNTVIVLELDGENTVIHVDDGSIEEREES